MGAGCVENEEANFYLFFFLPWVTLTEIWTNKTGGTHSGLKEQEWKSVSCETQSSQRRLSKIYSSITGDDNPANVNERHKEMLNREKWNSISSLIGTRKYDYNIWMYII